ncbi:sugar-transfer associated ATP-grasp domain-containing protein [Salipaludibacillus aurantiacus]|uniref:Sugar-transfer associated ATP-grasp n=1 Tax=Salipaludibacillus aurantiacus TaxID=1601833 RepID=A0A1H9X5A1_9BACI|nr:sugar-transfer associated ATP-grasp domain-containing protein [Salipaludibacillus aurantiacus]SES41304.1 Sugar-transfer associated ATP-grasp [Salipaludibacillus aurantiacus]
MEKNYVNITDDDYKSLDIDPASGAFKRYLKAGLLEMTDEKFVSDIQAFWSKHYNQKVDPVLNIAFMNLTGRKDTRVVPAYLMSSQIIPYFNDKQITVGYKDKNIYDALLKTPRSAETVLKRVRGKYFSSDNHHLSSKEAKQTLLESESDLIIKPSNTNNGIGIAKLVIRSGYLMRGEEAVTLSDLEETYGQNFIVQKAIKQHPLMAAPHPSSVNTLRMVTLRWKQEIIHLLTFARFGANNDVKDNAGGGGVCLGLTEDGKFLDIAMDEHANTYTHHPTTNFCFKDLDSIPNFEEFKQFVIDAHAQILHHDFVSWDIAMDTDGKPVCIEANFAGATWLYQLAAQKPMFGDLTEEILQKVSEENGNQNYVSPKVKLKKQKRQITRYSNKIKELENMLQEAEENAKNLRLQNKRLRRQKKMIKNKYENLLQSKSWRYTSPFRTIVKTVKK